MPRRSGFRSAIAIINEINERNRYTRHDLEIFYVTPTESRWTYHTKLTEADDFLVSHEVGFFLNFLAIDILYTEDVALFRGPQLSRLLQSRNIVHRFITI